MNSKNKIIVIVGTTASGKTRMGVELADKHNGEIISADSRQVYRGLDVGTGKDLNEYKFNNKNIPYHLIDVADPKERFSLAEYQKMANTAINDILERGKLPIIVGGTGLYVQALVDGYELSEVKPEAENRLILEEKSTKDLYKILAELNLEFAKKINASDRENKRRLIRYIEIAKTGEKPVPKKKNNNFEYLVLGITWPKEELHQRICKRIIERLEKEDMVNEVEQLHKNGLTWERLEEFGLEYKYISKYLQEKMEYDEMVERLFLETKKFAKRQITWLKRWEKQGRKIDWFTDTTETHKYISAFLEN